MTMDRLKKQRGPVRTAVTKVITTICTEVGKDTSDKLKLKKSGEVLENLWLKLSDLDQQILDALLDTATPDDEWEAENETIQDYSMKISDARVDINEKLNSSLMSNNINNLRLSPTPSVSGSSRKTYKLPKIELKKFSGELTEWLGWWAQFKKIDEDDELHATDKFQYLVQSMMLGSRAKDLVERYPQSEENYPKVISALKERFGKKKLLKQVYVRELIKMIIMKSREKNESPSLSTLYDKLESHLRSLESLGVTVQQMVEFLFPMVESCLPEEILVAWQRSPFYGKDGTLENPPKSEMDYLLAFLKTEIEAEEQRSLAKSGFGLNSNERRPFDKNQVANSKRKYHKEEDVPTAAGLFNGDTSPTCIFCGGRHESDKCFKAQEMTMEEKKSKIKEKKACFACLKPGHRADRCKVFVKCLLCSKKHQPLLCPDLAAKKSRSTQNQSESQHTLNNLNCTSEVVLQTLIVNVRNDKNGKTVKIRALIDNGSQRSYIIKKTIECLEVKPVESVTLNHNLFGGSEVGATVHNIFKVELSGGPGRFSTPMKLLDQTKICTTVPRVARGSWMSELKKYKMFVSDMSAENPLEIAILIGADNIGSILTGRLIQLDNGLTATETKFGWTLMGRIRPSSPKIDSSLTMNVITRSVNSATVAELWDLESIGIRDPVEVKSKQEKEVAAKQYFLETVTQDVEGRYSVSLPWVDTIKKIANNRTVAEKRLAATTSKLISTGKLLEYHDIFNAWEDEGIISTCEVTDSFKSGCHYLPHRAVIKSESKTTPVRPVFDASCKVGRSPSLNDCMEKGPNLLELIPSILLRFRIGRIGVSADIRKAFLMIQIKEEDRDYLRFLWWEDSENRKLKIFKHNRVVFGMNCSPFLLGAVIEYHLGKVNDHRQEVAQQLVTSLYVDNCVTSVGSQEEYKKFKEISIQLMAEAKMELRQWECSQDNSGDQVTSVLGLKWDKLNDSLFCDVLKSLPLEKVTKRIILSQVQKIFDPLGFLCPAVLIPKLMLQRAWSKKSSWDDEVPDHMKMEFQKWHSEISKVLENVKIPRNATGGEKIDENVQLHVFSDASKAAYAAAVFLRVEMEEGVSVQLLQAKSRVAPLKKVTIPRLELLGCAIAARLVCSIKEALNMKNVPTYYWSDSSTAIAWIKRNDDWGTFVGNRVREICALTNADQWRHVPGALNPADLPSRGCNPLQLKESRWWEGPDWLKLSPTNWPAGDGTVDEEILLEEKKKTVTIALIAQVKEIPLWMRGSSWFSRNIRVVALVLRYIKKLRKSSSEYSRQPSTCEVEEAELRAFKLVHQEFSSDQSVICGLRVLRDKSGLIRVVTKLTNRKDSEGFKNPVLLPSSHLLVDRLIREAHEFNCHAGVQFLMGKLRERVWIIQGRRAVKKIVKSCVICRRFAMKSPCVPPAALPEGRVNTSKAFEVTGLDLAGPLVLKNRSKCWIVIFTCAVYRCVHLELVSSMSTEDFLMSLVRFSKRKRRPATIYSDNGTNFTGTNNLFKLIDWEKVERRTQQHRIQWRFNPPSAPWWGGWWERLIRSVKDLLKRMLGFGKLTHVQLETCLCEVEAAINNRPLTFVTEDQDDLIPLTPAMFIHNLPESECTEAQLLKIDGLQSKFKNLKQLGDELKARFRSEYLSLLVQRGRDKSCPMFKVGDIVLVGAENKKRIEWPMARIVELMPGKDGNNRVAKVKTRYGELIRPVQKLYPLEISGPDDIISISPNMVEIVVQAKKVSSSEEAYTRSGRQVRVPARYGE